MATPGELVTAIAEVLGLPQATVALHDRALAEQGLRRSGGRGRSSIKVDPQDAANLLIAVVAAPVSGPAVRDTVANLEAYASLVAHLPSQEAGTWSELRVMSDLQAGHLFGDAIMQLVQSFCHGEFDRVDSVFKDAEFDLHSDPGSVQVDVRITSPTPHAEITVRGARYSETGELLPYSTNLIYGERSLLAGGKLKNIRKKARKYASAGDLVQVRYFSEVTLRALGQLLAKDPNRTRIDETLCSLPPAARRT